MIHNNNYEHEDNNSFGVNNKKNDNKKKPDNVKFKIVIDNESKKLMKNPNNIKKLMDIANRLTIYETILNESMCNNDAEYSIENSENHNNIMVSNIEDVSNCIKMWLLDNVKECDNLKNKFVEIRIDFSDMNNINMCCDLVNGFFKCDDDECHCDFNHKSVDYSCDYEDADIDEDDDIEFKILDDDTDPFDNYFTADMITINGVKFIRFRTYGPKDDKENRVMINEQIVKL